MTASGTITCTSPAPSPTNSMTKEVATQDNVVIEGSLANNRREDPP